MDSFIYVRLIQISFLYRTSLPPHTSTFAPTTKHFYSANTSSSCVFYLLSSLEEFLCLCNSHSIKFLLTLQDISQASTSDFLLEWVLLGLFSNLWNNICQGIFQFVSFHYLILIYLYYLITEYNICQMKDI